MPDVSIVTVIISVILSANILFFNDETWPYKPTTFLALPDVLAAASGKNIFKPQQVFVLFLPNPSPAPQ